MNWTMLALYLAPIILLAFTTEAVTGFGSILVIVTLGAQFVPINNLVPIAVPLNLGLTLFIAIHHRREVAWRVLLMGVYPFMGLGLAVGSAIFPWLAQYDLRMPLGVLVVLFAVRELVLLKIGPAESRSLGRPAAGLFQFAAGVVHGIYATGGPLLVYSVSRMDLTKSQFRTTMCAVWATFNTVLLLIFLINGRFGAHEAKATGLLLLVIPPSILFGEWLHGRINERKFRIFVYGLLLLSGLALFR